MNSFSTDRPRLGARIRPAFAVLVLLLTTTCREQADDVAIVEAAMSPASCGNSALPPNRDFFGRIDPENLSDWTYNSCYKAWVVDLISLEAAYAVAGASINVRWADITATQAICSAIGMRSIFFEGTPIGSGGRSGTGTGGATGTGGMWPKNWTLIEDKSIDGTWLNGKCQLTLSHTGLVAGKTYRIAGTARYPSGTTRRIGIMTKKP
jgi:hypothetical protein